ncbi:hypothetical protein RRG08_047758 [Elysia crispata]|uniref:Uncharacterized protein n=1 Tax=Elysia crispata TaxID=231223 RepID=A0AAE1DSL0_9GAST|nr:hypothetical protein RRG08_047758 [Elysia crispata]
MSENVRTRWLLVKVTVTQVPDVCSEKPHSIGRGRHPTRTWFIYAAQHNHRTLCPRNAEVRHRLRPVSSSTLYTDHATVTFFDNPSSQLPVCPLLKIGNINLWQRISKANIQASCVVTVVHRRTFEDMSGHCTRARCTLLISCLIRKREDGRDGVGGGTEKLGG